MRKALALLLSLCTVLPLAACQTANGNSGECASGTAADVSGDMPDSITDAGTESLPASPAGSGTESDAGSDPVNPDVCESAQSFIERMTVGWNLGCSLSYYSKLTAAGSAMVDLFTPEGGWARSQPVPFDAASNLADIRWVPGQGDEYQPLDAAATVGSLGVSIWNFSLGESDIMTYRVESLTVRTSDGNTVTLPVPGGELKTDMSDGTGGQTLLSLSGSSLEGLAVGNIAGIDMTVRFIGLSGGETTPESVVYAETAWGNPVTTPEMICAVRDRGFNVIRAQVSWYNHMDSEGNVDILWMDRVAEVVDMCMDAGVYCIINTTGAGWLEARRDSWEKTRPIYENLWSQIAKRFADYGELLLFENCNEVLVYDGNWSVGANRQAYDVMNEMYQVFVDTVRAGGGYNGTRNLIINPYACGFDSGVLRAMKLPVDSVSGHIIGQVHCYDPVRFCFNETNLGSTDFLWTWGTDADRKALTKTLTQVKTSLSDRLGIPVIVGEFGTVNRVEESERAEYIRFYADTANDLGIKLIIFDDGWDFTVFDRKTLSWPYESIIKALFRED